MVTEGRVGVPVVRNEKKRKERKMRVRWPGDNKEKPRDCREVRLLRLKKDQERMSRGQV